MSDETGVRSGRLSKMLCKDEMDCQQCKLPKKWKAKDYILSLQNPQQCSFCHLHCHCHGSDGKVPDSAVMTTRAGSILVMDYS
jgi:hypothetical protein